MSLKVVIIGGGSSYTPEIIEGFIHRYESFPVTNITLVDIEAGKEKLEIIGRFARRMIQKTGVPIEVEWTLNRRDALIGADFVTTQIRVGGLSAREKDERIPLSHGVIGQETNGAGGIFKALRTIPVLMEICHDIHHICPHAWLINFTNPAGIVTEALLKYSTHKKVIGVCNIPFNMKNSVAEMMNCSANEVQIEFVGMNHFVFGKRVWVNGQDVTDQVLQKLIHQEMHYSPANIVSLGWSKEFLQALGMLPNPYHQYYFQRDSVLGKDLQAYRENGTRAEVVRKVEKELFIQYMKEELNEKPKELENRGGAYYSDAACSLMTSIYNNSGDTQTVNTLNRGSIPDLPHDAVIETNAVITRDGPRPITIGPLPPSVKGIIQQMKAFEELVIQAAMTGEYNHVYQAMVMNPLVQNEGVARQLVDELLEAHKEFLPQFN